MTTDWLQKHFYEFVFPAFHAAEGLSENIGPPVSVRAADYAPKRLPSELRKLWTLCHEAGVPWSTDVREFSSGWGSSAYRESAKIHDAILRNTLDSAVVSMRAERCSKLLLAGRDVWSLAVLAERRSVPYVFLPEISRNVAESHLVLNLLSRYGVTGDELLVDTGFAGSIPRALSLRMGREVKFRLMSQSPKYVPQYIIIKTDLPPIDPFGFFGSKFVPVGKRPRSRRTLTERTNVQERHPEQLFPNRKVARGEALETEYLAKYWKTGTTDESHVIQYLATRENIMRAAVLTSKLWRGLDWL